MKKKIISLLAVVVVVTVAITCLVACNAYDTTSIGGGSANADSISNGGNYVEQGDYAYFINGFVGEPESNEYGDALKQSIVRAELNADGTVNNSTSKVVVPMSVYNKSINGGIAVFGDWIYYAVTNHTKDKNGNASTTLTDFMRTKIDGSVAQVVGTINSREAEYLFTPTRVLYFLNSEITAIDFTKMDKNKNIDDAKGSVSSVIASNVQSYSWNYDPSIKTGDGISAYDYVLFTQTNNEEESYKFFNKTYAMKTDGSAKQLLITENSYLEDGQDTITHPKDVFKIEIKDTFVEDDNNIALYYTKTYNTASGEVGVGLYVNKFNIKTGLGAVKGDSKVEKQLTALTTTELVALGYDKGAIVVKDSNHCLVDGSTLAGDNVYENVVVGRSVKIQYVEGDYVYYTEASSAEKLFKINLSKNVGTAHNETVVYVGTIKIDGLGLEFVKKGASTFMYFTNTSDYAYTNYIDIQNYDVDNDDSKAVFIGIMTDEDKTAKEEAEKAEKTASETVEE